jgi:RNA polymerase sigma-70 factor (ECF subfamily)
VSRGLQLAAAFLARASGDTSAVDRGRLGDALIAVLAAAAGRWPGLSRADAERAADLGALWAPGDEASAEVVLPPFAGEVVLARACAAGDPIAIAAFQREMLAPAERVLGRLGLPAADVDDVLQDVHAKLLTGERPRLTSYEGTGPLAPWVAAVAGREGLSLLRRRRPSAPLAEDELFAVAADPELAVIHARHGAELKQAFQGAVGALGARERAVLRALVIDERSVGDVAALFRIHRVTASRWVAEIRRTLLRDTRRRLQHEAGIDPSSLDSAMRLVDSGLEMSLSRLLADAR